MPGPQGGAACYSRSGRSRAHARLSWPAAKRCSIDRAGAKTLRLAMTMTRAPLALIVLAAVTAVDLSPAAAQYRPWCAQYSGRDGGARTCTFSSFEQCMMTATPGSGAHCVQNPWYLQ